MNASSTDSRRVCAFRLSCFVFCEITASLPSCRPSGRSFCILVPDTPGPEFVENSRERARRSPARDFQRFDPPLGAARKPTTSPGLFHGEARKPTRRPDFFTAKCESRPRRPDFFTAKRESRPRHPDFFTAKRKSRLRRSDFSTAKRKSRPPRRTSSWRSAKADNGGPLCPGALFRPRGRPERRASL